MIFAASSCFILIFQNDVCTFFCQDITVVVLIAVVTHLHLLPIPFLNSVLNSLLAGIIGKKKMGH